MKKWEYGFTDERGRLLHGCLACARNANCAVAGIPGKCAYDEPGVSFRYVFVRGKHKGKTVADVMVEDVDYLIMMVERVEWFVLSPKTREKMLEYFPNKVSAMHKAEIDHEERFVSCNTKE